jgi:hypothetical protein
MTYTNSAQAAARRKLRPLATLAMAALIGSGCLTMAAQAGADPGGGDEQAAKYSECMRANGVADFPDPNADGQILYGGVSVPKPVWVHAVGACKALEPSAWSGDAGRTPEQQDAALKFAQAVLPNSRTRRSSSPSACATTGCRTSPTPPPQGIPSSTRRRCGAASALGAFRSSRARRRCAAISSRPRYRHWGLAGLADDVDADEAATLVAINAIGAAVTSGACPESKSRISWTAPPAQTGPPRIEARCDGIAESLTPGRTDDQRTSKYSS